MAFFAVNENESSKNLTSRSLRSSRSNIDLESDESTINCNTYRTGAHSTAFESIRYLNPATHIHPEQDSFVSTELIIDKNNNPEASAYMPPPPLDLSRDSWSSNELTYTHRRGNEKNSKEHIRNTEAFEEWLTAKIEAEKYVKQKKCEAERRLRRAQEQEERLRCHVREQKLKEWFERKRADEGKRLEELRLLQADVVVKPTDPNESAKNYNAWLSKKIQYEKALKEKQKRDQELQQEYERLRRKISNTKYLKWLETAKDKPKPVPLNQGLLTLRGTVSSIFINPIPWVSDIDDDGNTKTL